MERSVEQKLCGMIAMASGDALGWPNERKIKPANMPDELTEFIEWTTTSGGRFYPYSNLRHAGDYSDDTQLALCTARALQYTNWREYFAFVELPMWLIYERGGGSSCKTHAKLLAKKRKFVWNCGDADKEYYYQSGGNGGVMRVLPHVFATIELEELVKSCLENNIITHGSPVAYIGTAFYAVAMYYFYNIYDKSKRVAPREHFKAIADLFEQVKVTSTNHFCSDYIRDYFDNIPTALYDAYVSEWQKAKATLKYNIGYILDRMGDSPEAVLKGINLTTDLRGSALLCAVGATYIACVSKNLQEAVCIGANLTGADTDSLASMAGGLYGLTCTSADVPDYMGKVQDFGYIVSLNSLITKGIQEGKVGTIPSKINVDKIKSSIINSELHEEIETPIGIIKPYAATEVGKSDTKGTTCVYALLNEKQRIHIVKHYNI